MHALLYISTASQGMDKQTLSHILDVSIKHNAQNDITGILLYRNQKFMQLLEGECQTIKALYDKITSDNRHSNCQLLHSFPIKKRNIDTWSMGFLLIEPDDLNYQYIDFVMHLMNNRFKAESAILHHSLMQFASDTLEPVRHIQTNQTNQAVGKL